MKIASRYILLLVLTLFVCLSTFAQVNSKHVKVKGYTRSDGTYVAPYYRTVPNSTNKDNFSTKETRIHIPGKLVGLNPTIK